MGRKQKLISKILRGTSDANIDFDELCWLLVTLGFEQHIRGSHHIFKNDSVDEIINLQPKGAKAKKYQVKQVRDIIVKYEMIGDDDD